MTRVAKTVAQILGITLIVLGLFAFVPNPIIGVDGYFGSDAAHNGIHIGLGLMLLAASAKGEQSSTFALYLVFAMLSLFAFLGYRQLGRWDKAMLMDAVLITKSDTWLHLALALVAAAGAKMNTSSKQLFYE